VRSRHSDSASGDVVPMHLRNVMRKHFQDFLGRSLFPVFVLELQCFKFFFVFCIMRVLFESGYKLF
jgi:hypothetical protein